MDFITALPDNLLENILLKLPLRDAARTCILSTRWRHIWVKLPELNLDSELLEQSMKTQSHIGNRPKFAMIVSHILSQYQGPITAFRVESHQLKGSPEVDSLIKFVSRYEIKVFHLQMCPKEKYKLPSSIFTCPSLTKLHLSNCEIPRLPTTFTGFNRLKVLTLFTVTISVQQIRYIVSNSPSLRTLLLRTTVDILHLGIKSPSLRTLGLLSYLHNLNVGHQEESMMSISNIFEGLPNLKSLRMDCHSVQSLFAGRIPTRLLTLPAHINLITLHFFDLREEGQLSCILCLLRSTPHLKEFHLQVIHPKSRNIDNLEEEEDYSDISLSSLEKVRIESVVGGKSEMQLIKLLLTKSPSLKKMTIKLARSTIIRDNGPFFKEMLMFKRAAPNVEVHIKN